MQNPQQAFTLVELSIVLVILGLLIGGVLTGQSLIRAAELRSVSTQHAQFTTAIQTFRDKYFALPGDMTNATLYWGVQNATPATCNSSASTDAKTCNGNGDGQITNLGTMGNEWFRFWQHLANAGLIEGQYNGVATGSVHTYSATKVNVPSGKISSSLWFSGYSGKVTGAPNIFDGEYGNGMQFGAPVVNEDPSGPILKPEEAFNIDTKTDDGKPAAGKIVAMGVINGASTSCTDGANSTSLGANYRLSNTAISCAVVYRQQF